MRLIDADALKRKAQRVATESWKMKMTAKIETVLNQFIDWIDNAPTIQPEQRWIPVSERLPDIDEDVLVSDDTWIWKDCLEVRHGKVQWYHNETLEGTAWMPLPEPYQEGEQE